MNITGTKTIAVTGAGTMGALIAQTFAAHGYQAVLWNRGEADLAGAGPSWRKAWMRPPAERDADFVPESITEDPEVKRAFCRQPEPLLKRAALVSTNTFGLSITVLSEALEKKPIRVKDVPEPPPVRRPAGGPPHGVDRRGVHGGRGQDREIRPRPAPKESRRKAGPQKQRGLLRLLR